jgi:hypothetical protein
LLGEWQSEEKGAALVWARALGPDAPIVCSNDVFGNRQSNAAPTADAGAGFIHAIETGEDVRQVFLGYANTCVLYFHEDFIVFMPSTNADRAPTGCVLEGIAYQVQEHLTDPVTINVHYGEPFWNFNPQVNVLLYKLTSDTCHCGFDQSGNHLWL